MVYLVTGRRRNDGWPFAGEVVAGTGTDAAHIVRRWGIEPEFVQDIATGRVEFRTGEDGDEDGDGDGGGGGGGDTDAERSMLMRSPQAGHSTLV